MNKYVLSAAVAVCALAAVPSSATIVNPGASGLSFSPFATNPLDVLLASTSVSDTALTFSATLRSAVYRNAGGTLDFYYQVVRDGSGSGASNNNQEIKQLNVSAFGGFTVDALVSAADPDDAGIFTMAANPFLNDGVTPSGSTTRVGRSTGEGDIVNIPFGLNGLSRNEISATYILRTNAVQFDTNGTFGIINGSTVQGTVFQPLAGIPEPTTWAMMIGGFGLAGAAVRRRKSMKVVAA